MQGNVYFVVPVPLQLGTLSCICFLIIFTIRQYVKVKLDTWSFYYCNICNTMALFYETEIQLVPPICINFKEQKLEDTVYFNINESICLKFEQKTGKQIGEL